MRTVHRPLSELYHDLDDAVNVLANSSFELTDDDGNLTAWRVLAGSAKQVSRGDSHAMLFSGRVRSTRFECNARVPYEWLGEAKGRLTGQVFFMEGDMLLRSESFVHESADWEPFVWRFLPPPNAERAECELEGDGALVDELRLDGLGAEDYRFLDPQAGFHPAGLKRVILQTRVPIDSEVAWELFDTLNGQTHAKGMLEPLGQDIIWRRWSYARGLHLARARGLLPAPRGRFRTACSNLLRSESGTDSIRSLRRQWRNTRIYSDAAWTSRGYHKACHTNDAVFRVLNDQSRYGEIEDPHDDSNGFRDVTGGWHDAGDYNKWFHYFGYVEETLALMWKRMDLPKTTYGGEIPDVLSEVFWGADFFAKLQNRDGSLPGPICGYYTHENPETGEKRNSPWAIFWEDPHEDAGAGEHLHPRTRTFDYVGHNPNPGRDLDLAASVAAAARCARGVDDARCGRYVNMVLRTAGYVESAAPELATSPFWLTLYYDLYRATDNEEYLEKANGLVPKLLAMQKDDGSVPYSALHKAFRPIDVLLELLIDESNHPMRSKIIAAAEKLVAWLRPHRIGAPYELTTMPVADVEPGVLDSRTMGRNAYIGSVAYTYALVARVTGNRELLHEAERQLGWLLGVNPHGVCQVTDAGRVHPNRYHGWHNRNDNDKCGALTGGIINGIHVPKEDGDATHPWTIQPPRFPILSVRRGDVPYSEHFLMNARHDTNEYWFAPTTVGSRKP